MAKSSAVSDTQSLLQSMLQKLKLQNHSERSSTPTQEQAPSPTVGLNGRSSLESTVYQFGDPSKQQGTPPSVWTNLDSSWRLQLSNQPHLEQSIEGIPATLEPDVISDSEIPRWNRKQLKISHSKVSDDSSSLSSSSTTENTLNPTDLPTPSPTSSILSQKTSEKHSDHSGVCSEGVGDIRKDSINVPDKIMRTRTSRTSKRKWEDPGKKRWTQKVKERWKERHKKERDGKQKQESNDMAKNDHCPAPTKSSDDNTTATLYEQNISDNSTIVTLREQNTIHPEPINNGLDEAPPSPLDHMSESIFPFGTFNLMEEIFTGKEWASFFQTNTGSQPEFTCITADKTTESLNTVSQSPYRERTTGNQWDYKEAADSNLRTPSSQMKSGSFQEDMDITEQPRTSDLSQTFEFLKDKSELFASNQIQSMDLGLSQSENDEETKYQPQLQDLHQNYQLNTAEASYHQSLTSERNLNQSQQSDPNHTQPETVHEEFLPLLDLSYLQPKDSSSPRKFGTLSRKRGHCMLQRGSSDRGRSETGELDEWGDNAPLNSLHPAPSLSPASSISSFQDSNCQDSESSASIETIIKKRRLENTRRVRFAEEVVFLPPLVLSEDYDDEDDNDDYDNEEEGEASDEDEDDVQEEPQSRSSVPNWIVALRTKAKRKPKLKLPQMASKPTKFKISKS
ncbi:uncharacterized protein zgc:113229 [Pygocentrus nattereri]|uniref:Uncharacterized protein n=1 Tax=Pygocentrus nattereri TaxID=42514 RepID=A0A3B4D7N2_PYGNA|nr:uncharacterized protein zgc:113229 [Pygocentrus nattereri]